MKDNQLIIEYYEGDKEYPIKVTDIKPYPDYGKGYYEVFSKGDEGEFVNIVCVQDDIVLVLPKWFIEYNELY